MLWDDVNTPFLIKLSPASVVSVDILGPNSLSRWWLPKVIFLIPSFLLHLLVGFSTVKPFSSPQLLTHSFIHLYPCTVTDPNFIPWMTICYCHLFWLIVPGLARETPSSQLRCLFWHFLIILWAFPYFIAQQEVLASSLSGIFSVSALGSAISPRSAYSFRWRKIIRNQDLGVKSVHCLGVSVLLGPLSNPRHIAFFICRLKTWVHINTSDGNPIPQSLFSVFPFPYL